MSEQNERLSNPNPEELIQRLQTELEFLPDETGEWLINDNFTESNGMNGNEFLPTRVRISTDGRRLEFGLHKEDLIKNLELARIAGQNAQDLDFVRNFWPEDHRITVTEDEEVIFFGAALEPTVDDFESQFQGIHDGLEVPMEAAAQGITYEQAKSDDNILHISVRDAETVRSGGHTGLFPKKEDVNEVDDAAEDEVDHSSWAKDAVNLKTYPLETYEKSVSNAPYEVRFSNETFTGTNANLIAHNYRDRDDVRVYMSWHVWDEAAENHGWNHISVVLPIPEGVEVKTVEDISRLTTIELEVDQGDKGKQTVEMPVVVSVDEHDIRINSEDGEFALEVKEPQCAECEKPIWKFRWPTDEENHFRSDERQKPIIVPMGTSAGNGVYYHTMEDEEGHKKMICVDDYPLVEERYVEEHPLARRTTAVAAVRAKLDELGYSDVQLLPEQTWPIWRSGYDDKDGLELFAYVEYERDGRKIVRRAGVPILLWDGTVIPNMPSREYVEFR